MTKDQRDSLIDRDWSDEWETLPEAPDIVPRPRSAQITLRLPAAMIARLKRVAASRSLPYHALARSWIIDGLRNAEKPQVIAPDVETQTAQLNIKLDRAVLDQLKLRAHESQQPYHRLARDWIEQAIEHAEQALGLDPTLSSPPAIKELMILLLHAPNAQGDSVIRGITRLQKLLFVIEQKLTSQSSFYAFNYGPFNEEVNDAARALELAGFVRSGEPVASGPPSFEQMMATVTHRVGRDDESNVIEFELNAQGHEMAERLRQSSPIYEQLFEFIQATRKDWDAPKLADLVDRVYETWPKHAEKSLIREEVSRRTERRRGK